MSADHFDSWEKKDAIDAAFMQGRSAWYGNTPRLNNPYKNNHLQKEWWKGYDNARSEQMQRNLKGIGKY